MLGIIPSKNSAFRLCKPLPLSEMTPTKSIVVHPSNPHGYKWRTYTESHIRQTLRSDIQKRNFLLSAIERIEQELDTYGLINSIQTYKHYIFLQKQKEECIEHLKHIENKLDIHVDYQLYQKFKQ